MTDHKFADQLASDLGFSTQAQTTEKLQIAIEYIRAQATQIDALKAALDVSLGMNSKYKQFLDDFLEFRQNPVNRWWSDRKPQ